MPFPLYPLLFSGRHNQNIRTTYSQLLSDWRGNFCFILCNKIQGCLKIIAILSLHGFPDFCSSIWLPGLRKKFEYWIERFLPFFCWSFMKSQQQTLLKLHEKLKTESMQKENVESQNVYSLKYQDCDKTISSWLFMKLQ